MNATPAQTQEHDAAWVPADSLANRIVLIRRELGIPQDEAAARVGITKRIWRGMEEGRSTRNEVEVLTRVAEAFNVSRDWLIFGGPLNGQKPRTVATDSGSKPELPGRSRGSFGLYGMPAVRRELALAFA